MIGGVVWWDFDDWSMLKFRYLRTTCVRQILIGFFPRDKTRDETGRYGTMMQ